MEEWQGSLGTGTGNLETHQKQPEMTEECSCSVVWGVAQQTGGLGEAIQLKEKAIN